MMLKDKCVNFLPERTSYVQYSTEIPTILWTFSDIINIGDTETVKTEY